MAGIPERLTLLLLAAALLLGGCLSPRVSSSSLQVTVNIQADGGEQEVRVPAASTVQAALQSAGLSLGSLDKVEPAPYTLVEDGITIRVTRVREEFDTEQAILPFERQTVRNESMPQGETRLIQRGENGAQEYTYRRVYENEEEVSNAVVKVVVLKPATPEIVMLGAQSPFIALPLAGRLVYLAGGSAWLMEGSTAQRRLVYAPEDPATPLDGRILRLSPDGKWLLFTLKSSRPASEEINTLWALRLDDTAAKPVNLRISNVVHFADWVPGATLQIVYSTVEPRAAAPGWQANNNIFRMKFAPPKTPNERPSLGISEKIIEVNSGGIYGWWGSQFTWSPDGRYLAYSRPDGIGLVSFKDKVLLPLVDITPLQTRGDWALIPGLTWGADSQTMYFVTHAPPPGLINPEQSPYFDLGALSLSTGANVRLARQTGMFAYPAASPARRIGDENAYHVAYLQSLAPLQSETSGYRLMVMDRDGSNRRALFPAEGTPGLAPQTPLWAPAALDVNEGDFVAVIYQDNLWMIDAATGQAHQVTGDGLIKKFDWK